MKGLYTLVIILVLFYCNLCYSQDSITIYQINKIHLERNSMRVLGTWGLANISTGLIAYNNSSGTAKYFHKMNAMWNTANVGLALIGILSSNNKILTQDQQIKKQGTLEKVFKINTFLDLGYVATGFYLQHRGNDTRSDKLKGYGSSVILQGTFLFVFDAIMYNLESKNGKLLTTIRNNSQLTFNLNGISFTKRL